MRLSELIKILNETKREHGDLLVLTTSESMTHTDMVEMRAEDVRVGKVEELARRYMLGVPRTVTESSKVVLL